MNQPSTDTSVAPAATGPVPGSPGTTTLEQRVESMKTELRDADASPESTGEPGANATSSSLGESQVAPVVLGDAAQRATERRARLENLKLNERSRVDTKAQQAASDKMARDLEAANRRAETAEKLAGERVDLSTIDEAALFALAEKRNISPQRLGEWIRDAMTNPEKRAEAAALQAQKTTYDPKLTALEKRIAQQDEQIQGFLAQQEAHAARAQEREQTQQFFGLVQRSQQHAPLAAKLLAADPGEFLQIAELAAARVPGGGPQALLDAVEEVLDGDARKAAQLWSSIYGDTPTPSQATAHTTPQRAAAMANTVSNSSAQGRASIVDDDSLAGLTLEQRVARIKSMK